MSGCRLPIQDDMEIKKPEKLNQRLAWRSFVRRSRGFTLIGQIFHGALMHDMLRFGRLRGV
jgi:hypothetical protein